MMISLYEVTKEKEQFGSDPVAGDNFCIPLGLAFVDKIPHPDGSFLLKGQHSPNREPACFLSPHPWKSALFKPPKLLR
jgi:hypothetical protein